MNNVELASIFGFCKGVEASVNLAVELIKNHKGEKLYTAGELIHNKWIVNNLAEQGIIPISGPEGYEKGIVLICAHGITPTLKQQYIDAGFKVVDGTCRIILRNQKLIGETNNQTIFIGKKNHPETISTMAFAKRPSILISQVSDLDLLERNIRYDAIVQTTYSSSIISNIKEAIKERGLDVNFLSDICNSSQRRRDAVKKLCETCESIVIIGDKHSANSQGLKKIAEEEGKPAFLVSDVDDITPEILRYKHIGLSAGASVPMDVITRVRRYLINGEAACSTDSNS